MFAPNANPMGSDDGRQVLIEADPGPCSSGDDVYATLGAQLRHRRKTLGLTQADIGKQIGRSISAVSRIEDGIVHSTLDRLTAFAGVLGTELSCHVLDPGDACTIDRLVALLPGLDERGRQELTRLLDKLEIQAVDARIARELELPQQ